MKKIMISAQVIFCLGLTLSLFPTQIFAQETTPVLKIQDQNNEEEKDEEKEKELVENEVNPDNEKSESENQVPLEPETELPATPGSEEVIPETKVPEITESEEIVPEVETPEVQLPQEEVAPEVEISEVQLPQKEVVQPENIPSSIEALSYIPVLNQNYGDKGYVGSLDEAILEDNFTTKNYTRFLNSKNPFMVGQCTWFAWSRFYQVYGFDSGAHGNGKTNALEVAEAHPDKFELSSTPAAGSVFSMEKNTLYPEYGHVGFIEAYDGEYIWISEGNVKFGDNEGNIWIHKVKWADFKAQYPDVVFAIPREDTLVKERFMDVHETFLFL